MLTHLSQGQGSPATNTQVRDEFSPAASTTYMPRAERNSLQQATDTRDFVIQLTQSLSTNHKCAQSRKSAAGNRAQCEEWSFAAGNHKCAPSRKSAEGNRAQCEEWSFAAGNHKCAQTRKSAAGNHHTQTESQEIFTSTSHSKHMQQPKQNHSYYKETKHTNTTPANL